jgi:hypothetical protein
VQNLQCLDRPEFVDIDSPDTIGEPLIHWLKKLYL